MKEVFLALHVEELSSGGYLVTCQDLPGLVAQGQTEAEAIQIAQNLAVKLVESYLENSEEDDLPLVLQDYFDDDEIWDTRQPN